MLNRFRELLTDRANLIVKLKSRHSGRAYHNWDHILAILQLGTEYSHLVRDVEVFFWMTVFHDAIYESERQDNEVRSAELARQSLTDLVSEHQLVTICSGISATSKHQVPTDAIGRSAEDISMFLDCDLAILGSDREIFQAYDKAIRIEYSWVPEPQWREGRAAVMRNFLARSPLYFTSALRDRFEASSRLNISSLIKELSATA